MNRHSRLAGGLLLTCFIVACGDDSKSARSVPNPGAADGGKTPTILDASLGMDLSSHLPPQLHPILNATKLLLIADHNVNQVFSLNNLENLDIVIVTASAEELSTQRVTSVLDWAKGGKGVLFDASAIQAASRLALPGGIGIRSVNAGGFPVQICPASQGRITENVMAVSNAFWCSLNPQNYLWLTNSSSPDLAAGFREAGEVYLPALFNLHNCNMRQDYHLSLFASTYAGARIAWYANEIESETTDCLPQFDDVQLWLNLVAWLAGKDVP